MNQLIGIGLIIFGLLGLIRRTRQTMAKDGRFTTAALTPNQPTLFSGPFVDGQKSQSATQGGAPVFGLSQLPISLDDLYVKWGTRRGIDPDLLKAIAIQESDENPNASGTSGEVGLMQVLCRPNQDGFCTVNFNVTDWPPPNGVADLLDPDKNLQYASEILRWNIDFANGDIRRALAIYNGGINSPPRSDVYAAEVLARFNSLKGGASGTVA